MALSGNFIESDMGNKKLFVVGAGGHGRAVAEAAVLSTEWAAIEFIDDTYPSKTSVGAWPIVADTSALPGLVGKEDYVIIAIGHQATRRRLFEVVSGNGATVVSVIHPKAWVSAQAQVGAGTAVMAGAIVGTQAQVGKGAIINANATVDHDAILGDFAHIGVGVQLAGGVVVGASAWLQAGSCAGYRVKVPAEAVVAPGTALAAED